MGDDLKVTAEQVPEKWQAYWEIVKEAVPTIVVDAHDFGEILKDLAAKDAEIASLQSQLETANVLVKAWYEKCAAASDIDANTMLVLKMESIRHLSGGNGSFVELGGSFKKLVTLAAQEPPKK